MAQHSFHSHYETLRVDRNASADEIRVAYRRLAQEHHPDRYQGPGDSAELMAQINAAYGVLSDFSTRVRYDSALAIEESRLNPRKPRPSRGRAMAVPRDLFGWPFMLMFGTAAISLTVFGFVVMNNLAPKRNSLQVMGGAPPAVQMIDPMPLVASQRIQPWTPPAKSSRPVFDATEPVLRLVSEGTMKTPPSRRYEQASAQ